MRFSGSFALQARDWRLKADTATLYGPLENPDTVVIQGSPAHIWVHVEDDNRNIQGSSERIEYDRLRNIVRLSGAAELNDGTRTFNSGYIEFDIKSNRVSGAGSEAGSRPGVHLVVQPDEKEPSPHSQKAANENEQHKQRGQ